jgi:hypothetical protein|tara:strand:- start:118 stop:489 length:372 start_codon:yes stop_codon:yes gene_type:complete
MPKYTLYKYEISPEESDGDEVVYHGDEYVKDGFSIWGLIFGFWWLLVNYLWVPAIIFFAISIPGAYLDVTPVIIIVNLIERLYCGIYGNELRSANLIKRGYTEIETVEASSKKQAANLIENKI